MPSPTPDRSPEAETNRVAHMGRVVERGERIAALKLLLVADDKATVLASLKEQGYRFGEGFDKKELPQIREAMQQAIAQMEGYDDAVPGLATAINRGLVQAAEPVAPEAAGSYETQLEGPQVEWVTAQIEAGYERSQVVNAPLLKVKGVPAFPTKEAALKSALKQLTPKQVEFMMTQGRSPFTFQVKISGPNNRLDLARTLVNGQPHRMDLPAGGQKQSDLKIWEQAEQHMSGRADSPKAVEWKWSFYQSEQIIEPEQWDDVSETVEARLAKYKEQWAKAGMKGTDRFSQATAMADGLERGKPLDVRFNGDATNTAEYEVWNFTVLDEEGGFTEDKIRFLVGGIFYPYDRYADLNCYNAGFQVGDARFRAAADGVIEA